MAKKNISKDLEEDIKFCGTLPVTGTNAETLTSLGIPKEKQTYNMMLAIATYENAIEGNSKFFDLILSVLGCKEVDRIANKKLKLDKEKIKVEKSKNEPEENETL